MAVIGLCCLSAAGGGFGAAAAIAPATVAAARPLIKSCPLRAGRSAGGATTACQSPPKAPVTITTGSPTPGGTTPDGTTPSGTTPSDTAPGNPPPTVPGPTLTTPGSTPPSSDVPPPPAPPSRALDGLRAALDHDINGQGGHNSALVIDETSDRTLWQYNASVPRLPASIEKLYTTSTALLELGPDATFETRVLGTGSLGAGGIWNGNLYLRGGGDPTFGSTVFDRKLYRRGATVQTLVRHLRDAGIRQLRGRIIGDQSYFDSRRGGPATRYRANLETEGSLSALAYDAGFTNLDEDRLQRDPALSAADAFTAALRAAHVLVPRNTPIATGRTPAGARTLASVASPHLSVLLQLTNSPSDNFFAEMLLKDLGARLAGHGTTAAGAAVVRRFIAQRFKLHPRLNDGSGLSRYDRTSPEQVIYLLRAMQSQPAFWDSLAVAGVRGTMRHEMLRTRGARNCRGKTGTLHDVANLVGYCRAANGDQLVFAFLMNGLTSPATGHELEDAAGEALADYRG